ncbi:hypothetical protein N7475_002591 [Penicillium sp. IBT 31633x]|nr:hypothetical protein N7475_002591 [Penicillium sp. IBT 31633x]
MDHGAENPNSQINIPAVAKHFGIRNNAAQMRFTRLKKKVEGMEASPNSEDNILDTETKDEDHDEDQGEAQIEERISDDHAEVEEQAEVKSEGE